MHEKCDFHTFQRAKVRTKLRTAKYSDTQNAIFSHFGPIFLLCSSPLFLHCGVNRNDTIDDILGETSPRQCAEILRIVQLNGVAAIEHQLACNLLVLDRELELVRLNRTCRLGADTRLNQLTLVGLEQHALMYNVVQLTTLDALAEGVVEAHVAENRNAQNHEQSRNATDLFHSFIV